jgi:dTDP-4-amino-4,6-dideoxygalactose transaminase
MKIPYLNLSVDKSLRKMFLNEIDKVLESGQFILSNELIKFEENVANYLGDTYVVGVNSGLSALVLSLKVLGIGCGDEVITVANSFVATVAAIELVGATPVLVDVGEDRNLDPDCLEAAYTSKTRAMIPVHLAGRPCDMTSIMQFANSRGLYVVEDASQAFGAKWEDCYVGKFSTLGCFSLHPTKNFGACGDAGIITTSSEELYKKLLLLRNHGLVNRDECVLWGDNSRLDEIQAAILNVKMNFIDDWNTRRRSIANYYNKMFKDLPVDLPIERPKEKAVYFTYAIQLDERDSLRRFLADNGIDCRIHYPIPIHRQEAFVRKYGNISLKVTERQNERILSLPLNTTITDEQVAYVADVCIRFFN